MEVTAGAAKKTTSTKHGRGAQQQKGGAKPPEAQPQPRSQPAPQPQPIAWGVRKDWADKKL